MVHPLVTQLWFTRKEFIRCLEGVSAEDAIRRIEPMNCLSWIVGHLASQEHYLWLELAQGKTIAPDLHELVGYGRPASTPPWEEMWDLWRTITQTADDYLGTITSDLLSSHFVWQGKQRSEDIGTTLLRNIYHYWFHTGEAHAIRQSLGYLNLPQFVGDMTEIQHSLGNIIS
jgi:hypothetical protein